MPGLSLIVNAVPGRNGATQGRKTLSAKQQETYVMNDVTKPIASIDYDALEFHPLAGWFDLLEGEEFDALVDSMRGELQLAPKANASRLRPLSAFIGPRADQLSLEFGQAAEHSEH
jgi:hypothetical protein